MNKSTLESRIRELFCENQDSGKASNYTEECNKPFSRQDPIEILSIDSVIGLPLMDSWLDTPNPSFGGKCPRSFLDGTDEQRTFLSGIVDSIEDGAFS